MSTAVKRNPYKRPEMVISGQMVDVTYFLREEIYRKTRRLLYHDDRILRLQVHVIHQEKEKGTGEWLYVSEGRVQLQGKELTAYEASRSLERSLDRMVEQLDRELAEHDHYRRACREDLGLLRGEAVQPPARQGPERGPTRSSGQGGRRGWNGPRPPAPS